MLRRILPTLYERAETTAPRGFYDPYSSLLSADSSADYRKKGSQTPCQRLSGFTAQ